MSRDFILCDVEDNVLYVSNLMKKFDVGFVLVISNDSLFGVVTDRDLLCDLGSEISQVKVFASKDVIWVDENKSINDALDIMKKHKIKRLVVTSGKSITGVLSLSDIYNTDTSCDKILETLKVIYAINRNDNNFDTKINEFIL